jgi:hypothetical protein
MINCIPSEKKKEEALKDNSYSSRKLVCRVFRFSDPFGGDASYENRVFIPEQNGLEEGSRKV